MQTLMTFEGVSKSFRERTVLDSFSLTLRKGEVIAILGPSGCGKTTILKLAAGLIHSTSGNVTVHTDRVGYIFQEPRLIPWKTASDNIRFVMNGTASKEDEDRIVGLSLQKVGLYTVGDYYPKQLSGGMKQRVSIARALAADPAMILMDEPFSALDISLKRELQDDMAALIEERDLGVIYVTHDPEEAARLADRVILFSPVTGNFAKQIKLEVPRRQRNDALILTYQMMMYDHMTGG
ncbi:ABC transporter ATP-binding protein [Paenibacillus sp. FSL H8-0034]|uniref:ABC transporter ATP-binding protein n=1 Tax=Paenibacillus sp. FSL H8-0034 TaxID=2954671 RepID=UPI0030F74FB5